MLMRVLPSWPPGLLTSARIPLGESPRARELASVRRRERCLMSVICSKQDADKMKESFVLQASSAELLSMFRSCLSPSAAFPSQIMKGSVVSFRRAPCLPGILTRKRLDAALNACAPGLPGPDPLVSLPRVSQATRKESAGCTTRGRREQECPLRCSLPRLPCRYSCHDLSPEQCAPGTTRHGLRVLRPISPCTKMPNVSSTSSCT